MRSPELLVKLGLAASLLMNVVMLSLLLTARPELPSDAQQPPGQTLDHISTNPDQDLAKVYSGEITTFQEISALFEAIAHEKGALYAYALLREAELPSGTDMHLLGHVVGDVLYAQQGVVGMQYCTPDFRNACSHTVVIGLFQDYGLDALPEISQACHDAPGGKGAYTMCFHGLGHGVLAYAGYDFERAVEICQKVGTEAYGYREAGECVGGAMMEMISGVHDPVVWEQQAAEVFSEEDPLFPCSAEYMPDVAKPLCITYQTPQLIQMSGGGLAAPTSKDFTQAFKLCQGWSDPLDRELCYAGFGKEFIVLARSRDIRSFDSMSTTQMQTVESWCSLAPEEIGKQACLLSAAGSLYWGGENDVEIVLRFCSSLSAPNDQTACYRLVIDSVRFFVADQNYRVDVCERVPAELVEECSAVLKV